MNAARPNERHLQGLAGFHAVASQLALKGHNPCAPGVDYGFDILLDTGVRIQVKSSHLYMSHPAYPVGAYRFSIRENVTVQKGVLVKGRPRRSWKGLCDYFIFWGINENRFFIVPCAQMVNGTVYIRRESIARKDLKRQAQRMQDDGMKTGAIAEELGLSVREARWLLSSCARNEKFLTYENAWDELDINKVLKSVVLPKVTIPLEVRPLEV